MKLYICITHDKYELPIAVADSVNELSEMLGVKPGTIYHGLRRFEIGLQQWCQYKVVEVDDLL